MKIKPCIGYAPVVDGEIFCNYTSESVSKVKERIGYFHPLYSVEIIKVEIRPVKKKSKPKKKGN